MKIKPKPSPPWQDALPPIIGIDEVGRGPWAGPVVACAFMLSEGYDRSILPPLADSKALTVKRREATLSMLEDLRDREIVAWALGTVSPAEIDAINIRQATRRAMSQALDQLDPELVRRATLLIDGRDYFRFETVDPSRAIYVVRGDTIVPEIQAASVIAKVSRDRLMDAYALEYPEDGFERHRGYGTRLHRDMLTVHGILPIHRKSFRPIRDMLS